MPLAVPPKDDTVTPSPHIYGVKLAEFPPEKGNMGGRIILANIAELEVLEERVSALEAGLDCTYLSHTEHRNVWP